MATWSKDRPYNQLPDLPPKGFVVDGEISAALVKTRVALARVDQAASLMTNPDVLTTGISILESQASSEIENIVTTRDALFESIAAGRKEVDQATSLALEYRAALLTGALEVSSRPVGFPLIQKLARMVLGYQVSIRSSGGTFIGGPSSKVVYTPPEGTEVIAKKLDALLKFVATSKLDPLVTICLAHYQFEAIHPFPDGNGRVGRLLNVLWLTQLGLLQKPVIAPSIGIAANRVSYYKHLEQATSKSAYKEFVLYMLGVFEAAAKISLKQVTELGKAQERMQQTSSKVFPKGVGKDLADLLFLNPYARISHLVDNLGLSRPTAAKYLEELTELGFLRPEVRGRDKYFINTLMIEILEK